MTDDEKALALFRGFHERDPHGAELVNLEFPMQPVLQVGRCWAISYTVSGQRKPFLHRFAPSNIQHRPLLYVSADGKEAFLVKGKGRFTDRGFVG